MNIMQCYYDLKIECEIAQKKLEMLQDKRLELWVRFCGVKSVPTDKDFIQQSGSNDSKVIAFLHAYEVEKKENGYSLAEEIAITSAEIKRLKKTMKATAQAFENLRIKTKFGNKKNKVIYALFERIVINGESPTQVVEAVAEEFGYADTSTIWRLYYPEVKKYLKQKKEPS